MAAEACGEGREDNGRWCASTGTRRILEGLQARQHCRCRRTRHPCLRPLAFWRSTRDTAPATRLPHQASAATAGGRQDRPVHHSCHPFSDTRRTFVQASRPPDHPIKAPCPRLQNTRSLPQRPSHAAPTRGGGQGGPLVWYWTALLRGR